MDSIFHDVPCLLCSEESQHQVMREDPAVASSPLADWVSDRILLGQGEGSLFS